MREPFFLESRLLPKVWGGRALESVLGMQLPPDDAIGEAWLLYDRPEGSSPLRDSDLTLGQLVRRDPEALVGRGVPLGHDGAFPLLLKFLDAREALSLQVHPDDGQAEGDGGKDECCVVLHATPDARIVHGVKPGVDRERFLARWQTTEVEELVYSFRPEPGDLVHIPPGTVHGIGPGVLAFEVQQNSDLTYRFYDWGRGREVHIDRARRVVDVAPNFERPVRRPTSLPDGGELLMAGAHFAVRRYDLRRAALLPTHGRYLAVTVLGGAGRLDWTRDEEHGALPLAACDTLLVPACVDAVAIVPDDHIDLMVCDPGAR